MKNLRQIMSDYSRDMIEDFNPRLFERTEDDITQEMIKVVKSAEREKFFTIKVTNCRVIDSYKEVFDILYDIESSKKPNKRVKINIYDYINLKDSDIYLLQVDYFLQVGVETCNTTVYIALPRIVDKYYFRLSGSVYSAVYQIVDASTYNNSTTSNKTKDKCVMFKTKHAKTMIYKRYVEINMFDGYDDNGEVKFVPTVCACFVAELFGKRFPALKYILAKMGIPETLGYLCIDNLYLFRSLDLNPYIDNPNYYTFYNNGLYITVSKLEYNNNEVCQSLISTILSNIVPEEIDGIFTRNYWKCRLSNEYKNSRSGVHFNSSIQGDSILESFNHILDIRTRELLRLPEECKRNMFDVLKWILYEFEANVAKSNTDISIKRIRFAESIAAEYAIHLCNNVNNISNLGTTVSMKKLIQAVSTKVNYLTDRLKKSSLVAYNNSVNDMDGYTVSKYTFKGISGMGEKKTSAVPTVFRYCNASHLGRLDRETSSAGDPGMTGIICPYVTLDKDLNLGEYKEPNSWYSRLYRMHQEFNDVMHRKDAFINKQYLFNTDESANIAMMQDNIDATHNMLDGFYNQAIQDVQNTYPNNINTNNIGIYVCTNGEKGGFRVD